MKRAFTHDPTTFSYEVMTTSNIGWRPYWIVRLGDPSERRLWRPQKMSSVCSGLHNVPIFMLVDTCAQQIPKPPDYNPRIGGSA